VYDRSEKKRDGGMKRSKDDASASVPKRVKKVEVVEEDPEEVIQRRLAKKLGIKGGGKMKADDGLDDLLGELDDIMTGGRGSSSGSDGSEGSDGSGFSEEEARMGGTGSLSGSPSATSSFGLDSGSASLGSESGSGSDGVGDDDNKDRALDLEGRYVPPALRRARQDQQTNAEGESAAVLRKVRGLINRMTESNLEGIVGDLATMYRNEGRSWVSTSLSKELITGSTEGPRASERFAITAAAAVASLAGLTESSEVVATFLSMLGRQLEASLKGKDSLACSNLVRLLGCLYLSKAIKADLMFDVLDVWSDRERGGFTEEHIVSIVGLLTVSGLALRKADPALMKEFVVDIHDKASREAETSQLTTRARVMLDLVVDVKNNRMKNSDKKGVLASLSAQSGAVTLANALPPNVAQWFRGSIGRIESVAVGGIPWRKVVQDDNRGFWWLQGVRDGEDARTRKDRNDRTEAASGFTAGDPDESSAELLKLAKKLRMSTDTRRTIFLAVMSSEDAIDAAEKLLRLNLKGAQEREIVRVTVECCMHESAWNPYYGLLITRLCALAKGHRVTLNYCLWDFIKDAASDTASKLKNGGYRTNRHSIPDTSTTHLLTCSLALCSLVPSFVRSFVRSREADCDLLSPRCPRRRLQGAASGVGDQGRKRV